MSRIDSFFRISERHSTIRNEVVAGLTTFLAMAYITVVNPSILADAGMDFDAVFVATCLAAAFGSTVMGLLGNYPIAQAPGMGQNAFFTYVVVLGMGHTWQAALGAVFLSGLIFIVLSILPVREWLINAIPRNLKFGISAGIGLFIGFIALRNGGIVVENSATFVSLGKVASFGPAICLLGFVTIAALTARKISGAVIIGVLIATVIGWVFGGAEFLGVFSAPPSMAPVFLELDIAAAFNVSMVTVVLTFLLVDVFDTAGTMVGVATRAGLVGDDGKLPRLGKALLSDSSATALGALVGTSSTTSFIESAAGVEAGGRTGLTAVTVGVLFLACLFFAPLAQSVPAYATASALLFVACLMTRALADVDWDDLTESAPAVVTALSMPLAFSVADGIGLGFLSYVAIKILTGKATECPSAVYVIALVFALKFLYL